MDPNMGLIRQVRTDATLRQTPESFVAKRFAYLRSGVSGQQEELCRQIVFGDRVLYFVQEMKVFAFVLIVLLLRGVESGPIAYGTC
uniref:Uncharacterized protein n=1 Tax=Romanomermis culicivorax TaxID=13658 RepID=A0A915JJQ9_ROMCU